MRIREDVLLGQHSHVGMARTANEDFFGYWEPDEDRLFDLKGRLAVVCDGMGGHAGGEIASRMAVKTIIEAYEADPSDDVMEALRRSIERANETVYKEGLKPANTKLKGMGSTVTCVVQRRELIYFGQVGDSRCYLIRRGLIQQMTKDHSLVQQLVDEGLLDKSEMENHPDKNVILRSLGVKPTVDVDISYVAAEEGDVYLICSDGLSGLVTEQEMLNLVTAALKTGSKDLRKVCEQLVDLANKYGGHDNITVQLLQIVTTKSAKTDTAPKETVTQSFSQDEVAASVAKARAEAAARGKTPKPPADAPPALAAATPAPASGSAMAAGIPVTQPSMPVPTLAEAPRGGGGGAGKLVLGLLVGALLGAGGLYGLVRAGVLPAATAQGGGSSKAAVDEVRARAEQAEARATDEGLRRRGKDELALGRTALDAGRLDEARAHFHAAAALFLAGGAQ
ncbi:MAG: Stp1/IreP family PP2C-type Ser/Thr phosphatase [Planctomycetes bacterium]|nr:Stp1/IreP family PP2C-type Ser/Thr phosphatase [Planctomycetota bacterium]